MLFILADSKRDCILRKGFRLYYEKIISLISWIWLKLISPAVVICFQVCKVWYIWLLSVVALFFFQWPRLGQLIFSSTLEKHKALKADKEVDVKQLNLHKPLESTWPKVNKQFLSSVDKPSDSTFTPLQRELFSIMNSYRDLFYPERNALTNGEEIRHTYCLHALNHVLKANAQVLSNNAKRRDRKPGTDTDEHRDQGLTRPKVRELWFPDPHPGCLLRLYKRPGSLSTSICVAALSGDAFLGMCFSTSLYHAWKLSSMGRTNALWEAVSSGLLASLVLCPPMSLTYLFLCPSVTTDWQVFLHPYLNLPVQTGATTSIFSISAGSVGCHPMWDVPETLGTHKDLPALKDLSVPRSTSGNPSSIAKATCHSWGSGPQINPPWIHSIL